MADKTKREVLLQAASEAIADHGVRGLRVEDVAERAGVVVSLLYYYFGSRSGLLEATLDFVNERAPGLSVADLERSDRSAYELLERSLLAELGSSDSVRQNCVVWNELNATAVFDPELQKEVATSTRKWTATAAEFIRAGQLDGSMRADVDAQVEAEIISSLLDGAVLQWLTGALPRQRARLLLRTVVRDRVAARVEALP